MSKHIRYYDDCYMLYRYLDDKVVLNMKQLVDIQDIHFRKKFQFEKYMKHVHMDHHTVLFQYEMLDKMMILPESDEEEESDIKEARDDSDD